MSDKTINSYKVKSNDLEIVLKDLDEGSRKVSMYLSSFDEMDSDNDIIRRGAFKKSIQERGPNSSSNRKIAFLRYHNWEKPIGKFLELREDQKGLYAVAQLSKSDDGMNAFADYQEGVIREHSIGFRYVKDKIKYIEDENMESGGYYEINEVALFEGSAVTFGANEFTNVVDVAKSEGVESIAKKIHDEINIIGKALSNGSGTDERLYSLEMRLKFLNARYFDLVKSEPFNKNALKSESIEMPFDWNKVITNVKI
jgi:HK97 family phage prohead protease